jgi:hypothetical protein
MCCYRSIIPGHRRWRQKDHEFKVRLDYTVRPASKKKKDNEPVAKLIIKMKEHENYIKRSKE